MSHHGPHIPPAIAELANRLGAPPPVRRHLGFGVPGGEWVIEPSFAGFAEPPPDVHYCLGKRSSCLRGDEGRMSCAEVEVPKVLRAAGWTGGWINTYGGDPPLHWASWTIDPVELPVGPEHEAFTTWLADLRRISGGTPDIIAVRGASLLTLECKRRSVGGSYGDSVRGTQERWVREAFEYKTLTPDQFAVVWWTRRRAPLTPPSVMPEHEPTRRHPDRGGGPDETTDDSMATSRVGPRLRGNLRRGQGLETSSKTNASREAAVLSDLQPSEDQLKEAQDGLAIRGWKVSKSKSS